jgi:polyhydroxybutyrate depolymerase
MRIKLLISLFVMTGFFIFSQSGVTVVDSIKSNGIYRSYRLYKPLSYNGTSAYPLVINLHGYGSNAYQQQYYSNFMAVADTAKFLIVHPQGTMDNSNQPYWNAGIAPTGPKDLQFISELIDSLSLHYTIDPNSIYSTGISNGGFMSNYMACNLSNKITAIASVAGTMFGPWAPSCNPPRPIPVMHVHGTADGTVPYNGMSGLILAVDSLMKFWRIHNNCGAAPTFTNLPDIVTSDGCTATRYLWSGGMFGSTNELYSITGGGHTWPGATTIVGVTNEDYNASVEIWRFFRKYKLNLLQGINELKDLDLLVKVYPNPTNSILYIDSDKDVKFKICDLLGKEILPETNSKTIDVSHLQTGIYFLKLNCEGNYLVKKLIKD